MAVTVDAEMERLYNARAAIPDHMEIFARWAERSAALRAARDCRLDVAYGGGARETMDFFPAAGSTPPLMMFIHGGYWQALDKSYFSFLVRAFVDAGIAVAVVGYELCPAVRLDDIVAQLRRAMAFAWRGAGDLGVDRDRLFVSGHSAGGHLTAMLMATRWAAVDPALPAGLVRGGVAVSGLFDLAPLIATTINRKLGLDAEAARRNSPLFMAPASPAPLVLAVGGDESAGFRDQSDRLAVAWRGHGCRIERVDPPGCHHMAVVERLADADSALFAAVSRMIRATAGRAGPA